MPNFSQIFQKLNQDCDATLQQQTGEAYSKLATIFEELDGVLREYIQELTKADIKSVIQKLQRNEALNEADLAKVRLWIVGDAEYYARLENNEPDWKVELKRLVSEMNRTQVEQPDAETAAKLRGLFRDGVRVINDLFFLAQQKDRIKKFEQSVQGLDVVDRQVLVRLLEQKMTSPDY